MNLTIENILPGNASIQALREKNIIEKMIIRSDNETELRENFKSFAFDWFVFGFGAFHMWVKYKNHVTDTDRIIFVEF